MPTRNPAVPPTLLTSVRWTPSAIYRVAFRLALSIWNALCREAERSDRQVPYC